MNSVEDRDPVDGPSQIGQRLVLQDRPPLLRMALPRDSLRHYDVELRSRPHPPSYEGLRLLRGMTIGVPYGEAFEIVRGICK